MNSKLKNAEDEVESLKEQMTVLFDAMLEDKSVPNVVEVEISADKDGNKSTPEGGKDDNIDGNKDTCERSHNKKYNDSDCHIKAKRDDELESLRSKENEERKRRQRLEREVESLKVDKLHVEDQMKSVKADRDKANAAYEALDARIGSADGANLSILRKRHQ